MDDRAFTGRGPSFPTKKRKQKVESDSDPRIQKSVSQPLGMMASAMTRIKAARQFKQRS